MISFLITHYNRPKSLAKCIESIHSAKLNQTYEIVVSDDFSTKKNIALIEKLKMNKLVLASVNSGLGSNINKGLKECSGDFIVYIQEDFALNSEFKLNIEKILTILSKTQVEMVRLLSSISFNEYKLIENYFKVIPNFSFKNFLTNHYRYSDNPFIVKKDFFLKYGTYKENVNPNYSECEYMIRMMKLNPKIALCGTECINSNTLEGTVREGLLNSRKNKFRNKKKFKPLKRIINSFRFILEYFLYNTEKRNLLTIKNLRKNIN